MRSGGHQRCPGAVGAEGGVIASASASIPKGFIRKCDAPAACASAAVAWALQTTTGMPSRPEISRAARQAIRAVGQCHIHKRQIGAMSFRKIHRFCRSPGDAAHIVAELLDHKGKAQDDELIIFRNEKSQVTRHSFDTTS